MSKADAEFLKKLMSTFQVESKERIQKLVQTLLKLEKETNLTRQAELIETIFREIHSLKSAARAVNQTPIEKICQSLEDVFAICKKNQMVLRNKHFDVLHKINDILDDLIKNPQENLSKSLENELESLFSQLKPEANAKPAQNIQVPLEEKSDIAKISPQEVSGRIHMDNNIRIDSSKLDTLLNQAEELLVTKFNLVERLVDLSQLKNKLVEQKKVLDAQASPNECDLKLIIQQLDMISNNLQQDYHGFRLGIDNLLEDSKKLLLWPFSALLNMFPRIVRELARDQGKEIDFLLEGTELEIDKRILEEMKDVLLHLVRNAVDHGIEKPDIRQQLNKPRLGTLKLKISQLTGNQIAIEIRDDGAGINTKSLRELAVKQKLMDAEEAERLTEEEAINLIYHSGISTSPILTEVSGRGLGMPIVREKVEKVGGKISIHSEAQHGTTFRIELPLTMATFKGVLVNIANELMIIPIDNLERTIRVSPADIKTVENRTVIAYNQKTTPIFWMSDILGLPRKEKNETENAPAIVVSNVEHRIAFVVDDILNEQEILVKNFSKPLKQVRHVSASAILGTGKLVPILNSLDLLHSVYSAKGLAKEVTHTMDTEQKRKPLLLAEDSITTRMLLKNVLELGGFQVTTAVDGLEAWTLLKQQNFAALVSDVEMPRMNGFELTEKVRKDPNLAELPIILVTSRESPEDRERGIDVGANAYVLKSTFDSSNLLKIIERLAS